MSSAIVLTLLTKLDDLMQSIPGSLCELSDFEDWGRKFVRLWAKLIENGVDVDEAPLQSRLTSARRAFANVKEVSWLKWGSVLLPHFLDIKSKHTRTEDRKRLLDETIWRYIEDEVSIVELHELEAKIAKEEEEEEEVDIEKSKIDVGSPHVLHFPIDAFYIGHEDWKFGDGKANDAPGEASFAIAKDEGSNKDSEKGNIKAGVREEPELGLSSKRKREMSEEVGESAEERQEVGEEDAPPLGVMFVARARREPSDASGRITTFDSGLQAVSGPCDRCAKLRKPQDCKIGDNDPRCVKCQRDRKGCSWGGISRSGKRQEDPEAKKRNRANVKEGEEAEPSQRPQRAATRPKERIVFAGKTPPRLQGVRSRDLEPAKKRVRVKEPSKSWADLRAELEVATEEFIRSNARLRLLEDHNAVLQSRVEGLQELVNLQESEGESEDDGE